MRYSHYRYELDQNFILPPPGGLIAAGPYPNPPHVAQGNVTPKFSISYQPSPDLFTYVTASEGFRPGGFNPAGVQIAGTVQPYFQADSLWNYEIGAKSAWLDRRLTMNAALYRINWNNMQTE